MSSSEDSLRKQAAPPLHVIFDPSPEIFATNQQGSFQFPLTVDGESWIRTADYDEVRVLLSVWHPSAKRSIEMDRAYVELRGAFDPQEDHWTALAEIEPVVPPYGAESFDGWIVLPVFATGCRFLVAGSGFEPRTRLQVRGGAYFVT